MYSHMLLDRAWHHLYDWHMMKGTLRADHSQCIEGFRHYALGDINAQPEAEPPRPQQVFYDALQQC
jgi:hypothetical protein